MPVSRGFHPSGTDGKERSPVSFVKAQAEDVPTVPLSIFCRVDQGVQHVCTFFKEKALDVYSTDKPP